VDRHVFVGRPRRLPLPRGVHDMAWLAGRPGGILIMWPAIQSHLSATTLITALILSKVDFYNVGLAESWPWASTVGHQCCCSVLRLERVNSTNCCISIVTWQLYSLSSSTAHRSGTITRAQTEQLESIQKRATRIIFPSLVKFPTDTHCLLQISTLCILDVTTFQRHSFKTCATHLPAFTTSSHPTRLFCFIPAQNNRTSPTPNLPY